MKVKITLADGSARSAKAKGDFKTALAKLTAKYARDTAVTAIELNTGAGRITLRGVA